MVRELNNRDCSVPASILDFVRKEIPKSDNESPLSMEIEGELPEDLHGHFFIVAPVGTVESEDSSSEEDNTYLNGDGMVYRLDFDRENEVAFKTEIVKPEDYSLDRATANFIFSKFRDYGIVRFSLLLGFRNQLNTAFLPMKFGDSAERLLVTYDAGIPHEIDPVTLNTITPVDGEVEWQAVTKNIIPFPFPPILSTAHPVFDPYTQQMFAVNYGRSLSNLLGNKKDEYLNLLIDARNQATPDDRIAAIISELLELLIDNAGGEFVNDDFVYLLCWDGNNSFKKWQLVESDDTPISIKQSLHQIGITEDYIVLMDTSFIAGITQLINNPFPEYPDLNNKIRKLLDSKPSPDSTIYIVPRDRLNGGQEKVVVQRIVIPREAAHFLVDYRNPDNKVTLHISHICAWNVAEWIRPYDESPYENYQIPEQLRGMQQCETDISWMGRYEIDMNGEEPRIASQQLIKDDDLTWGAGLFAYLDRLPTSGMTPEKIDNVYWVSFGLWKDLITKHQIHSEHRDPYPYREFPLEKVLELAENCSKRSSLYRLDTTAMTIPDSFIFPQNHIALSPQFMPSSDGKESSTNGYILCTVATPQRNEIWIFDAANLNRGTLCKLYYPELNFGFSLHTTWLKNINSPQSRNRGQENLDLQSRLIQMLDFLQKYLPSFTKENRDEADREIQEVLGRL